MQGLADYKLWLKFEDGLEGACISGISSNWSPSGIAGCERFCRVAWIEKLRRSCGTEDPVRPRHPVPGLLSSRTGKEFSFRARPGLNSPRLQRRVRCFITLDEPIMAKKRKGKKAAKKRKEESSKKKAKRKSSKKPQKSAKRKATRKKAKPRRKAARKAAPDRQQRRRDRRYGAFHGANARRAKTALNPQPPALPTAQALSGLGVNCGQSGVFVPG